MILKEELDLVLEVEKQNKADVDIEGGIISESFTDQHKKSIDKHFDTQKKFWQSDEGKKVTSDPDYWEPQDLFTQTDAHIASQRGIPEKVLNSDEARSYITKKYKSDKFFKSIDPFKGEWD